MSHGHRTFTCLNAYGVKNHPGTIDIEMTLLLLAFVAKKGSLNLTLNLLTIIPLGCIYRIQCKQSIRKA
jgi:hypothetical protein